MRHHRSCGVCRQGLREGSAECDNCGRQFHRTCITYHEGFDPRCGRERWLGIVEF